MVDTTLFIWDGGIVIGLYFLSLFLYFFFRRIKADRNNPASEFNVKWKKIPDARIFGAIPALLGFYMVGLYCVVSLAWYILSIILIESYEKKKKAKVKA